jgi:hypothetical protein
MIKTKGLSAFIIRPMFTLQREYTFKKIEHDLMSILSPYLRKCIHST